MSNQTAEDKTIGFTQAEKLWLALRHGSVTILGPQAEKNKYAVTQALRWATLSQEATKTVKLEKLNQVVVQDSIKATTAELIELLQELQGLL